MNTATEYLIPYEIHFRISAEDIAQGCRAEEENCPTSRAVRRVFPNADHIRIDVEGGIAVEFPGLRTPLYYLGSPGLAAFIDDYDKGRGVRPTSFRAELASRKAIEAFVEGRLAGGSGIRVQVTLPQGQPERN